MYVSAALCKNSALSSKKYHYPRFINSLIKEKQIAWKRWKHSKLTEDKLRYKKAALDCKTAISKFHAAKETELIRSNNIGSFYNFDNSRLKSRSRIHDIRRPDGSFAFSSDEKAKIFNTFFASVFTEQCCSRRRNLVPDESGPRFAWHTYLKPALETNGVDLLAPVSGTCVMGIMCICM